ncbi:CAMK/CAMKL/MARK protein kinase, partial [Melampsora americana]
LVQAYQELGKELNSTQLKVVGNYTLGRVIGEGSFGTVRIGIHRLTGTRVAIKHIPKSSSPPLLTREIHHHRRLHHPNVVQLYEVIATEHSIWLITELCAGGELFDYLVEKTRFTESETRRIFGQICLGLGYVHQEGVVHRDLKLENVLLDERCNPKLADFGFGREFEQRKLLDTFCGTTGYAAPEMLAGRKYLGEEVDIWSLGIIFYTLLSGSLPFDDDDEDVMKSLIMAGKFEIPDFLSNEARDLIIKILQQDPKARPSIENILSHSWFTTPPSQHTFPACESTSRPSTIAEEDQQLTTSPKSTCSSSAPDNCLDSTVFQSPSYDHSIKHRNQIVIESDTSESSSKESDLGIGPSRSNTSSPVTSEDRSCVRDVPNLNLSPVLASNQSTPVKTLSTSLTKPKQTTLVLQHRNNSNSTITKPLDPLSTPCSEHLNGLDEDDQSSQSLENLQSHKIEKNHHRLSSSSTSTTVPNDPVGSRKRRPQSIVPSFPSSHLHHPHIRTPSRTKRRSVGSTISERIAPIEDLDQAGLPMSISAVPSTSTLPLNNSLLASTSLSFVIDYLGAMKIIRQTPFKSDDDLGLLKSLSTIGFDTGQMMHSVQSNACDASGAMWWLLKRKLEKEIADREYAERSSARLSAMSAVLKPVPTPQAADEADGKTFEKAPMPNLSSSVASSNIFLYASEDRQLPASCPGKLRQPTSHDDLHLSPSNPRKVKAILTSSQTIEPLLNPIKIVGKSVNTTPVKPLPPTQKPDQLSPKQPPFVSLLSDETVGSTSSIGHDTLFNSEQDGPIIVDAGRLKLPAENRKRSQSVSMLQRATHALSSKKLADDGSSKPTKLKLKESLFPDGHDKPITEKLSKKDIKSKEKEAKMWDENIKPGSNSSRSGLFSRRTILPSSYSSQPAPQIPVLLTPEFSAPHACGSTPDRSFASSHGLESSEAPPPSRSMPSSPKKNEDVEFSLRRGNRKGSNLFSSFRFWFNEDRRKRKRKTMGLLNYSSSTSQGMSNGGYSKASSATLPPTGSTRKPDLDPNTYSVRTAGVSGPIHRQLSASSRRSSVKSSRRVSLDMATNRRGLKRRSDSSRASISSLPGSRSPTSEFGSQQYPPQLSVDGSRGKRHGHRRQGSNSSAGSRLSNVVVQHMGSASAHHPTAYVRRTPSIGTTVRRITTTNPSASTHRSRPSRNQSGASSVRSSISSEDELLSARSKDENHRLHSPINVHDLEETIEEEDDDGVGEEVEPEVEDPDEAREQALNKLSGGRGQKLMIKTKGITKDEDSFSSTSRTTTTIFLAHKPHSVFGTPTQAFFGRATPASPMGAKLGHGLSPLVGSGAMYFNGYGAAGSGSRQKIRDVFAAKQQQGEDGEWVDVDEDDDVCARYGGGLGQTVHRRTSVTDNTQPAIIAAPSRQLEPQPQPSTPISFDKISNNNNNNNNNPSGNGNNAFFMKNRPGSSVLGEGRYAGIGGSSTMLGVGGHGNSGGISTAFKSVAIVEEEEEED